MTKKQLRRMLELAKDASLISNRPDFKLGCIIFDTHRVWAIGCNTNKTSVLQRRFNRFNPKYNHNWHHAVHAEISAITHLFAKFKFKKIPFDKLSVLVYREHANGTYAMAKPCPACEDALRHYGFKNIYYTGNCSFVHEVYKKLKK